MLFEYFASTLFVGKVQVNYVLKHILFVDLSSFVNHLRPTKYFVKIFYRLTHNLFVVLVFTTHS